MITFDIETIIFLIVMLMPVFMFLIIAMIDMRNSGKSKILYFHTEKLAELVDMEISDGIGKMGKKFFNFDGVKPVSIKFGMIFKSYRPFYMIKHDKVIALVFHKGKLKQKHSAENFKNLLENKTLDALLRGDSIAKMSILFFVMGVIMGGLLGYIIATMS